MGANHRSAPLELREKLYIPEDQLGHVLVKAREKFEFLELAALSTCNRFEIMGVLGPQHNLDDVCFETYRFLQDEVQNSRHLAKYDLRDNLYLYHDSAAIQHIYRVASSLDSLVVGETQITGQFKDAINLALKAKTLGPLLSRLSQEALATAKKVRSQTQIGERHVSISHAAIDLAKKVFGDLSKHDFLVVGAGEMARIAVQHIKSYNPKSVKIANRSLKRANDLVAEVGIGSSYQFDEIQNLLTTSDIVISSTSAAHPVIDVGMVKRAQSKRRGRPMILVDIALPRDIETAIGDLEDVYLFDIDDLQQVVSDNLEERRKAALEAETLIEGNVIFFEKWLKTLTVKPALSGFRGYLDNLLIQELEKTIGKSLFQSLDDKQRASLEAMMKSIAGKMSGDASRMVKTPPEGYYPEQLADALKALFPYTPDNLDES